MKRSRNNLFGLLPRRQARRRVLLLTGGALIGLVLAATNLVSEGSSARGQLPPGAIAQVGSRIITQPEFERVVLDLTTDKRTPADGDRSFALQRVIEEELLVQRSVELGYPQTAPAIRKALAAAVITRVVAEAEALAPSDEELQEFYDRDAHFFARSARWRLRWLRSTSAIPATSQGRESQASLFAPCGIEDTAESSKFNVVVELPNTLLPLAKLMDYMGPTLATHATRMQPGECSEPVLINGAYHALYLEAYQPRRIPEFDAIRDTVEAEYVRRAGETALRDYLTWLRDRAEITVDESKLH